MVYEDKNRIQTWLKVNKLQLPLLSTKLDSIINHTQFSENVNPKKRKIFPPHHQRQGAYQNARSRRFHIERENVGQVDKHSDTDAQAGYRKGGQAVRRTKYRSVYTGSTL